MALEQAWSVLKEDASAEEAAPTMDEKDADPYTHSLWTPRGNLLDLATLHYAHDPRYKYGNPWFTKQGRALEKPRWEVPHEGNSYQPIHRQIENWEKEWGDKSQKPHTPVPGLPGWWFVDGKMTSPDEIREKGL